MENAVVATFFNHLFVDVVSSFTTEVHIFAISLRYFWARSWAELWICCLTLWAPSTVTITNEAARKSLQHTITHGHKKHFYLCARARVCVCVCVCVRARVCARVCHFPLFGLLSSELEASNIKKWCSLVTVISVWSFLLPMMKQKGRKVSDPPAFQSLHTNTDKKNLLMLASRFLRCDRTEAVVKPYNVGQRLH